MNHSKTNIFKYSKSKKIVDIASFLSIFLFLGIIFIIDDLDAIELLIGTIVLIGMLIMSVRSTYLFNKNFEIGEETFNINNRIIPSKIIRYNAIRRIIISEHENMAEGDDSVLTIFLKAEEINLTVSEIEKYYMMIPILEEKGIEYDFNVIHQDINGRTIRDLRGNSTFRIDG